MKDIRVDSLGRQRCWNCGGTNFTQQRTLRSKVTVGVGALATKKKLRCVSCGEYNDVGSAKPYNGPASKRAAKKSGALALDKELSQQQPQQPAAPVAPPPSNPPAGWYADPQGGPGQRWWDGDSWTDTTT
ncbi:MAG: DUF2510 domain-containing protein [Acidimicrobiia bacterium]|nr:DUF2510 domain-containing protein [Acidimicrobiia bacterium]